MNLLTSIKIFHLRFFTIMFALSSLYNCAHCQDQENPFLDRSNIASVDFEVAIGSISREIKDIAIAKPHNKIMICRYTLSDAFVSDLVKSISEDTAMDTTSVSFCATESGKFNSSLVLSPVKGAATLISFTCGDYSKGYIYRNNILTNIAIIESKMAKKLARLAKAIKEINI